MNTKTLDLNLFKLFEVIYQERNLTRAAEVMNLTQPAVSNALARLRDSLDDPLFTRGAKGMEPTAVAHNMIQPIRQALQLLDSSVQDRHHFDAARSTREIKLSLGDMVGGLLLPKLFQQLHALGPNMSLLSYPLTRDQLSNELAAGHVDLAVDVPMSLSGATCNQPLLKDRLVCLVRKDHPQVGRHLTLATYLKLSHLLVSRRTRGPSFEDIALAALGKSRRIALRLPYYLQAPLVINQTDLVMTVSERFARTAAAQFELKVVDAPLELPDMTLHLYWHQRMDQDPANVWLRQLVRDTVESLGFEVD